MRRTITRSYSEHAPTLKTSAKTLAAFLFTLMFSVAEAVAQPERSDLDLDRLMDLLVSNGFSQQKWDKDDPLLDSRTIVVCGKIHEEVTREVVGKLLYLDHLDQGKPISLYVRTTGGWLDDSFSIIDVMAGITSPVNVHAMGVCESAGVVLLIGATGERTAGRYSKIAPHYNQHLSEKHSSRSINYQRFSELYRQKTRVPQDWYKSEEGRDVTYYLSAQEALEYGIIDRIRDAQDPKEEPGPEGPEKGATPFPGEPRGSE